MRTNTLVTTLALAAVAGCSHETQPATPQATAGSAPGAPNARPGEGGTPELTAFIDPGAAARDRPVQQALAILYTPAGQRVGTVRFVDTGQSGLDAYTSVEGLPAGTHAYHVHVFGDCSAPDFKSAGPHFHFTGSSFDQNVKIITGNLGELTPDAEGRATQQTRVPAARLQGPYTLLGRSVVVHAQGNDPAVTPDGGAGARIACGVIGIANPLPPGQHSATR